MGKRFTAKSLIRLRPMFWSHKNQSTDFHSKSISRNIPCKWEKLTDGHFDKKVFRTKLCFLNNRKLHIFFESKYLF